MPRRDALPCRGRDWLLALAERQKSINKLERCRGPPTSQVAQLQRHNKSKRGFVLSRSASDRTSTNFVPDTTTTPRHHDTTTHDLPIPAPPASICDICNPY